MSQLWRPKVRSNLPLGPVWRMLGRHNVGVDLYMTPYEWVLEIDRLERRGGEWVRIRTARHTALDEVSVLLNALPDLPGIGVRLALMAVLLECG